mmetsp:Transcript_5008/g.4799  ORF Transcript_5008/g.4799 Transcript_5008/m.4799 type:complete len:323 (+) Transcript_5008:7-975(+)
MANMSHAEVDNIQPEFEGAVKDEKKAKPTGGQNGVFFTMLTLVSMRIGGGLVGVPYATDILGYVFALCFQIIYLPLAMISCWMLLKTREISGRSSLSDIGIYCYGNISIYVINFIIALAQLGFPIIFFIVFGDVFGNLIERMGADKDSFWTSRWFTQTFLGLALLYFCIQKDISKLKYNGFVILFLCFGFLILFFLHYLTADMDPEPKADLLDTKIDIKFFTGFTTLLTSYAFQSSLFTVFAFMKNKTTANGMKADGFGRIIIFIVYTIAPLIAYGLYGDNIEKNLLKSVANETKTYAILLEVVFIFVPCMAIPNIFFVGKE